MNEKTKHLDYIQGIINRMADNSFKLKGWSVTLVTGLFALSATLDERFVMILISFVPVLVFWILDGYFLYQERLFRGEYNRVRKVPVEDTDFLINPTFHEGGNNRWFASIISKTLVWFYGMLLLAMGSITLWLILK